MGRCLVEAAKRRGHKVTAVECPKDAQTARDLLKKLKTLLPSQDVLIMAAAVCDARPKVFSPVKIKKERLSRIALVKNPDILKSLSQIKRENQIFIGFAIESSQVLENGYKKLKDKHLESIVLQKVEKDRTPFGDKRVQAFLLDKTRSCRGFRAISKKELSKILIARAENLAGKWA